jgi:hypothetical protein
MVNEIGIRNPAESAMMVRARRLRPTTVEIARKKEAYLEGIRLDLEAVNILGARRGVSDKVDVITGGKVEHLVDRRRGKRMGPLEGNGVPLDVAVGQTGPCAMFHGCFSNTHLTVSIINAALLMAILTALLGRDM